MIRFTEENDDGYYQSNNNHHHYYYAYSIKCKFCSVMLTGRDQFIGHMFHNHDFSYEGLKRTWRTLEEAMESCSIITRRSSGIT